MAQYSSDRFAKDFPELSSKYTELLEAQRSLKGLDPKTRQLDQHRDSDREPQSQGREVSCLDGEEGGSDEG